MILLLPVLAALAPPGAEATCACSCWGPGPLDRAYTYAHAVFTGRVTAIEWDERGYTARVRIAVETAWKWPHLAVRPPAEIVVRTDQGPACGAYFGVGEDWVVFAEREFTRPGLWTGQCTGTERFDPGTEEWRRRRREEAEERVRWLQRNVGRGTRPAA